MLWAEPWFVTPCSDVGDGDGTVEEAIQSHGNTEDLTTLCVCVCVCVWRGLCKFTSCIIITSADRYIYNNDILTPSITDPSMIRGASAPPTVTDEPPFKPSSTLDRSIDTLPILVGSGEDCSMVHTGSGFSSGLMMHTGSELLIGSFRVVLLILLGLRWSDSVDAVSIELLESGWMIPGPISSLGFLQALFRRWLPSLKAIAVSCNGAMSSR